MTISELQRRYRLDYSNASRLKDDLERSAGGTSGGQTVPPRSTGAYYELELAADTFRDFSAVLKVIGKDVMSAAADVAERHIREFLTTISEGDHADCDRVVLPQSSLPEDSQVRAAVAGEGVPVSRAETGQAHASTLALTCHPYAHLAGCDCFDNPQERNPIFPRAVRIGAFDYAENSDGSITRTDWRGAPSRARVDEILSRERLFDSLTVALTEAETLATAIHTALACGDATPVGKIRPALADVVNAYHRGQ